MLIIGFDLNKILEREREGKLRRDLKFGVSIGLDWIGLDRLGFGGWIWMRFG